MHVQELDRVAAALGATPPVTLAAAHVYPAAAPDFEPAPAAEREPFQGDRLRLYVHIPFCNYKCNFCHYATRVGDDHSQQERYVAAIERELGIVPVAAPLTQLFMGGGTPTVLAADLLDRLLASIFARVSCPDPEVHTVEASPESLTGAHVEVLRRNGIGRISMGVQSLDDDVLSAVHRRHDADDVLSACRRALDAGIILNVDLMYGLPGQTEESFHRDLVTVAEQGVHSVTLYDLRATRHTPVDRKLREQERLDLAGLLRWRRFVKESAERLGFTQTRWHTFKRLDGPGDRHRRAPCNEDDGRGFQVGLGVSARSHLGYTVYRNHPRLQTYLGRVETGHSPVQDVFRLDEEGRRTQFLARTLGDGGSLDRHAFAAAFGHELDDDYGPVVRRQLAAGLLHEDGGALSMTETGRLVYDRVLLGYYPQRAIDWLWARA